MIETAHVVDVAGHIVDERRASIGVPHVAVDEERELDAVQLRRRRNRLDRLCGVVTENPEGAYGRDRRVQRPATVAASPAGVNLFERHRTPLLLPGRLTDSPERV